MKVTDHEEAWHIYFTLYRLLSFKITETMGILETMYSIVNTICCRLKKDDEKSQDIKIKIDEAYINKRKGT